MTVLATIYVVPGAPDVPPVDPPIPLPGVIGTVTSFPLPDLGKLAPYSSAGSSKHTNMAGNGKRIYVSGGDWTHSATDGTHSMDLADGSWRMDVAPTTRPSPHALQDGAGFEWVESAGKFLMWPGAYYSYEPHDDPVQTYARGYWWFDPVTNLWEQDLRLWGFAPYPDGRNSTGCPYGGVFDPQNGHAITFGDSGGTVGVRRWDVVAGVRLPDMPLALRRDPLLPAAYFGRTKPVLIGRDVYTIGYRTNGLRASQTPLMLRWNIDSGVTTECAPPPVNGALIRDLEVRPATSHSKLVWPFTTGPEGDIYGIHVYDPETDTWAEDMQRPDYGNFIGNAICSLPDGRVCFSGGVFGKQQTHMWFYEAH